MKVIVVDDRLDEDGELLLSIGDQFGGEENYLWLTKLDYEQIKAVFEKEVA